MIDDNLICININTYSYYSNYRKNYIFIIIIKNNLMNF